MEWSEEWWVIQLTSSAPFSFWARIVKMPTECMCVLSLQLCPALCNPMDCSPPGFFVHGILQARILEWVAMPSSRASTQPRDRTCVSYVSCTGRWVLYHQYHQGCTNGKEPACPLSVCIYTSSYVHPDGAIFQQVFQIKKKKVDKFYRHVLRATVCQTHIQIFTFYYHVVMIHNIESLKL